MATKAIKLVRDVRRDALDEAIGVTVAAGMAFAEPAARGAAEQIESYLRKLRDEVPGDE